MIHLLIRKYYHWTAPSRLVQRMTITTLHPVITARSSTLHVISWHLYVFHWREQGSVISQPKHSSAFGVLAFFCGLQASGKQLCYVLKTKINSISNAVISLMKSQCPSLIGKLPREQSERWIYQRARDCALGDTTPYDQTECYRVCPTSPPLLPSLCF